MVGHVLGGAIAARYAARRPGRLRGLILADSLGLARFRPSLRFALGFLRFASRPSERSCEGFMDQCADDRQRLQQQMKDDWTGVRRLQPQPRPVGSSQGGRPAVPAGGHAAYPTG